MYNNCKIELKLNGLWYQLRYILYTKKAPL